MIIKSQLLSRFPEVIHGVSTKVGENSTSQFYFNMSYNVGDNEENVHKNRIEFFSSLGIDINNVASLNQVHGDTIINVCQGGNAGQGDGLITNKPSIALAITTADCVPVFLFDSLNKIICAVHSGWRGTEKKIVQKAVKELKSSYNSKPGNIYAFIGPSISITNYEISNSVAELFSRDVIDVKDNKYFLDLKKSNYNLLIEEGLPGENIEVSDLCTFQEKNILHSFRRDGKLAGRSLGIISLRETNG